MNSTNKAALLKKLCQQIKSCKLCKLAQSRKNAICPEGNYNSRFFFVALSPGEREDSEDKMFIGPSGKVFHRLLKNAGIAIDDLYISNLIKCNLPRNRKPKMREIEVCSNYLDRELEIVKPELIITLGFYASRYILKKFKAETPSAKSDYRKLYGRIFYVSSQKIFLLPHPASILYNPDFEALTQQKYNLLQVLKTSCKWFQCCPMKYYYERKIIHRKWIELYCHGNWLACERYRMEENNIYHPDNMLPDGSYL